MTRTPGEKARRGALADAASGNIERVGVVLYVCVTQNEDGTVYAERCRSHAEARDWHVVKELTDQGDDEPSRKPGLQQALELIESREVTGIITPFKSCISALPGEYHRILNRVYEAGGFVKVLAAPHTGGGTDEQ